MKINTPPKAPAPARRSDAASRIRMKRGVRYDAETFGAASLPQQSRYLAQWDQLDPAYDEESAAEILANLARAAA